VQRELQGLGANRFAAVRTAVAVRAQSSEARPEKPGAHDPRVVSVQNYEQNGVN